MEVRIYEELLGKTFNLVENEKNELLVFENENYRHEFIHYNDCCEEVYIYDICGDLSDLIGSPLLQAEETVDTSHSDNLRYESYTWTFYKFATIKGSVTVRWLGTSNGCYSEEVYFRTINKK